MIDPADVRIVRAFRAWDDLPAPVGPTGVCPDCLEALLEGRASYLDRPEPTRWRRNDVRSLLFDLAVPRLTEYCDLTAHTVPSLRAYLTFLDATDRLHPASTAVRHLLAELTRNAPGFPAAMADRSRYLMAKTFYTAMHADGVRLDDRDGIDAWVSRFNQAPGAHRAALLEHLLTRQPELATATFVARAGIVAALPPGQAVVDSEILLPPAERRPSTMPSFAPVAIPSASSALASAQASTLTHRLLTLARWFDPGRKATDDGEPIPADVRALAVLLGIVPPSTKAGRLDQLPNLRELFWMARQLELVDLRRSRLIPGPRLQLQLEGTPTDDGDGLGLWRDVFTLLVTAGEIPEEAPRQQTGMPPKMLPWMRTSLATILNALYQAAAEDRHLPAAALVTSRTDAFLRGTRPGAGLAFPPSLDDDPDPMDEQAFAATGTRMTDLAMRIALGVALGRLADHGILDLHWPRGATAALPVISNDLPDTALQIACDDQAHLALTPLGRWAMHEQLTAEGANAPATQGPAAQRPRARPDPVTHG